VSFVVTSNKLYNLLLKGWFRIKGRSSRQEYILRFLMMWFFMGAFFIYGELYKLIDDNHFILLVAIIFLLIIVSVFFLSFIQIFFVTLRRLHDLNASGWWILITFLPFGQLLMIGFIFFKGTDGPNNYGPPPEY
jgi:uncharacterized membrane protein YhaH (DUF805 family)